MVAGMLELCGLSLLRIVQSDLIAGDFIGVGMSREYLVRGLYLLVQKV